MTALRRDVQVDATPEAVLAVVLDVESYPQWQREVVGVEVHERDDAGRPTLVTMSIQAMGKSGWYRVAYDYPDGDTARYRLVAGDMMRRNDATFTVAGDGDGGSRLTVELDLALVWPLPSAVVNRLARHGLRNILAGVRDRAEQG